MKSLTTREEEQQRRKLHRPSRSFCWGFFCFAGKLEAVIEDEGRLGRAIKVAPDDHLFVGVDQRALMGQWLIATCCSFVVHIVIVTFFVWSGREEVFLVPDCFWSLVDSFSFFGSVPARFCSPWVAVHEWFWFLLSLDHCRAGSGSGSLGLWSSLVQLILDFGPLLPTDFWTLPCWVIEALVCAVNVDLGRTVRRKSCFPWIKFEEILFYYFFEVFNMYHYFIYLSIYFWWNIENC